MLWSEEWHAFSLIPNSLGWFTFTCLFGTLPYKYQFHWLLHGTEDLGLAVFPAQTKMGLSGCEEGWAPISRSWQGTTPAPPSRSSAFQAALGTGASQVCRPQPSIF